MIPALRLLFLLRRPGRRLPDQRPPDLGLVVARSGQRVRSRHRRGRPLEGVVGLQGRAASNVGRVHALSLR